MRITKRQLRRIIREAVNAPDAKSPQQTVMDFTVKGIEGLIRDAERQLDELDKIDAELGEAGKDVRDRARQLIIGRLEHAREALKIKKMGSSQ